MFLVNGSHARIDILRTSVNDSGKYSVDFISSGNDFNFKDVQRLNIIEAVNPISTLQPAPTTSTLKSGKSIGYPPMKPPISNHCEGENITEYTVHRNKNPESGSKESH